MDTTHTITICSLHMIYNGSQYRTTRKTKTHLMLAKCINKLHHLALHLFHNYVLLSWPVYSIHPCFCQVSKHQNDELFEFVCDSWS